jgi:DsbC/DsbD-like thiol-disulfide interchange protein
MRALVTLLSVVALVQSAPTLQFKGGQPLSKHAAITIGPTPLTAAPGAKVDVFVDIVPNPGIHIYAPGAKDYQPVKLTLKPQPEFRTGKLTYPKSESLYFAPLKETVPVFQKPFRLTHDVTVAKSVKAGSTVTVSGTLDLQACDDEVCFIPESVPVSWTIAVK